MRILFDTHALDGDVIRYGDGIKGFDGRVLSNGLKGVWINAYHGDIGFAWKP